MCLIENVPHLRRSSSRSALTQSSRAGLKFGSGPPGLQSAEAEPTRGVSEDARDVLSHV
jgi:hypothetical protein